jgi:GNAT superfamily N-acetyltransferase
MDAKRLITALDATWPAAEVIDAVPGWRIRRGLGGGQRVSSASRVGDGDVAAAEAAMQALDQPPLFQLWPGDEALDADLEARGYAIKDPVVLYAAPAETLAAHPGRKGVKSVEVRARLVVLDEIWAAGGVGPARRAVMDRAAGPKTTLMARTDMRVGGVAFVAVDRDIAMIHAIEVRPDQRRLGVGAALIAGAARYALANGAATLALAVTRANEPARALYARMGMAEGVGYHYRIKP